MGVPSDYYFALVDGPVAAAVRTAIAQLEALGATVQEVRLPGHDVLMDGVDAIRAEALVDHEHWLRTRPGDYGEETLLRLLPLQFILANDHAKALRARRLLLERYTAVWREVDVLAGPTVPVAAPSIAAAEAKSIIVNGKPHSAGMLSQITRPCNYTGLPAISVPCGFVDGLPVGLMLVGRPFDERTLLRAAHAYEQSTAWHERRPAV